jgi:hypothetical protein
MVLSRSSRSFVASLTAVLLLLCQTAFAAQACAHAVRDAQPESIAAPCHEAASENTGNRVPAASSCEATKALPDSAKVPVLDLADLPTMLMAYEQAALPGTPSRIQYVQAVCHSPPLSILHCRFLN